MTTTSTPLPDLEGYRVCKLCNRELREGEVHVRAPPSDIRQGLMCLVMVYLSPERREP